MTLPPDSRASGPRSSMDDVIDCYKRDVDRTLLREALKLTPAERVRKMVELLRASEAMRDAGARPIVPE